MLHLHSVRASLTRDHGCITQQGSHGRNVERGRHHEDAQLGAKQRLRLQRERQAKVAMQVALVKLVEQHDADALERRIVEQHSREHTLGDDLDSRGRTDARVATHAKAYRRTNGLAEQEGHAVCRCSRGEAARFEHQDLAAVQPGRVEQGQRNARRLSGSRWSLKHHRGRCRKRHLQLGKRMLDGQRGTQCLVGSHRVAM